MIIKQILIAHRGDPERWPENSIAGFQQALSNGAQYIETDVQITADGVPVLSHDPSLLKLTGQDHTISETPVERVLSLSAGYPERFKDQFNNLRINTLSDFSTLISEHPKARAFIEIKPACLVAFGADRVIDIVLAELSNVHSQCILISFDFAVLQQIRQQSDLPIGWVLPEWDESHHRQADQLNPDYLFINRTRLPPPPEALWHSSWQWVVYTLDEIDDVRTYVKRGFDMIETNRAGQLINATLADD